MKLVRILFAKFARKQLCVKLHLSFRKCRLGCTAHFFPDWNNSYIFSANKSMWSVPNVFIVNMTISDLMMTCLNCSFNYIYMRDRIWYYNQLACTVNNFTAILTVSASVLNMSALSINR